MSSKSCPVRSGSAWHPLRCLARTDITTASLFHSFYFVDIVDLETRNMTIAAQVPSADRLKDETVSEGLLFFVGETAAVLRQQEEQRVQTYHAMHPDAGADTDPGSEEQQEDKYGTFVLTAGNAQKYYLTWRGTSHRMFIAASTMPLMSTTRCVLDMLHYDCSPDDIISTLMSVCEIPVLPSCALQYNFLFPKPKQTKPKQRLSIQFSSTEQVNDAEVFSIAMHVLNPSMALLAWQSVMLERKVLVKSATESLVGPTCEYIKRLVMPYMLVQSYVPVTHEATMNVIEAPFPYLVGVNSELLDSAGRFFDLSDIVIIDLDART